MKKIILAVVGLPGSGKTEATKYILKKTGWKKVYFGDVTFNFLKKHGLKVSEANERKVREEIRRKHGMGAYAKLSLPKIRNFYKQSSVVLESLYSWEEYLEIKQEFGEDFKVLAIYSSPKTREGRLARRLHERPLTSLEFQSRDYSQISNLHQAGPIARADFTMINEGKLGNFYKQLDGALRQLKRGER